MPTISIISPCYNVADYVGETIQSVFDQSLQDWEYIVVDDGSIDGTAQIADAYAARDARIRVVRQPNRGASAARNAGFRAAHPSSRYVIWLDGDDLLGPNMLETMVAYLEENKEVGLVFCNRQHIDAFGNPIMPHWAPVRWVPGRLWPRAVDETCPDTTFASLFVQDAVINPTCSLFRRSVYECTSGWNEQFAGAEDWDLSFQMALAGKVHYLPRRLVRYRMGRPGQATAAVARGRSEYGRLYLRWSRYEGVASEHARTVYDAIRFREGQVLPMQWLSWATAQLRQRQMQGALRMYALAAKYFSHYALKSVTGAYGRDMHKALGDLPHG